MNIKKIICNLYIPINAILCMNDEFRKSLNLPKLTNQDIKIINQLKNAFLPYENNMIDQRQVLTDSSICIRKVKSLSFYGYLSYRLIDQAKMVAGLGIRNFLIENSLSFNNLDHSVIYWLMRVLVSQLKLICTDQFKIGIRLNNDKMAMDIAVRNNIDFVLIKECNDDVYLYKNMMMNSTVDIGVNYNNFSYYNDIMVIDTKNVNEIKIEQKLTNCLCIRNNIRSLKYFPESHKIYVILDLWDEKMIKTFLYYDIDYVVINNCFSINNCAESGLDINKLKQFVQKKENK